MSDEAKSLNAWRDTALRIATEHGFTDASIAEDIALMHSELSEMLEDARAGHSPTHVWYEEKAPTINTRRHSTPYPKLPDGSLDYNHPYKPCGIPSELADLIIRALHFAGKHGIDIDQAVTEKTDYNETRPYKHNKVL